MIAVEENTVYQQTYGDGIEITSCYIIKKFGETNKKSDFLY